MNTEGRVQDTNILELMALEVQECNVALGWYDEDRTFGEDVALLHSEVSEMLEAFRDHGTLSFTNRGGKPEGIASEAADVLVRLLDTCKRYDIDLFDAWRQKVDYNWTREHRHGGKRL